MLRGHTWWQHLMTFAFISLFNDIRSVSWSSRDVNVGHWHWIQKRISAIMSATLLRAHIPGNNSTMNAISRCNSIQFNWIFFFKKSGNHFCLNAVISANIKIQTKWTKRNFERNYFQLVKFVSWQPASNSWSATVYCIHFECFKENKNEICGHFE